MSNLEALQHKIHSCDQCPRLREYAQAIGERKKKGYEDVCYWAKPVAGFGERDAKIFILGLAPSAHGANRVGRVLTGDASSVWLYKALYQYGWSNKPVSLHQDDGVELKDVYITCAVKCAPPDNKPDPVERNNCLPYLLTELQLCERVQYYVVLGKFAYDVLWKALYGDSPKCTKPKFAHGLHIPLQDHRWIMTSYHPSPQNTLSGRLQWSMWIETFQQIHHKMQKARIV